MRDQHGNTIAREGVDRCSCGCKYWENDRCVDCGAPATVDYQSTTHRYVRGTVKSGIDKGMPSTMCDKCHHGSTSRLHKRPFGRTI